MSTEYICVQRRCGTTGNVTNRSRRPASADLADRESALWPRVVPPTYPTYPARNAVRLGYEPQTMSAAHALERSGPDGWMGGWADCDSCLAASGSGWLVAVVIPDRDALRRPVRGRVRGDGRLGRERVGLWFARRRAPAQRLRLGQHAA
jgi:hypothetical protein